MIRSSYIFLALIAVQSAVACGNPIVHFLHKAQNSGYSEAYVPSLAPNKLTVDHKAFLRGLSTVKNCVGKLATFDTNEYAHFDNPLQLGFVEPPSVPLFCLRSKEKLASNTQALSQEAEPAGNTRFDFWIPL